MKKYADQNRSFRQFQVDDMVFLKLQPYIQASIAPRANHKLLFKYYGPSRALAKISDTSYKLELPSGSTIHPIFHVSLLRKALSDGMVVTPELPRDTDIIGVPCKVMSRRWHKKANGVVEQVLIQWAPGDAASATWEDREDLRSRFPVAPAWGQAGPKEGRGVRVPDDYDIDANATEAHPPRHGQGASTSSTASAGKPIITRRSSCPTKSNRKFVGPSWGK